MDPLRLIGLMATRAGHRPAGGEHAGPGSEESSSSFVCWVTAQPMLLIMLHEATSLDPRRRKLAEKWGGYSFRTMKDMAIPLGGEDAEFLRLTGRAQHECWFHTALQHAPDGLGLIIESIRYPGEAQDIHDRGGVIIEVECSPDQLRGNDDFAEYDFAEPGLVGDYVVRNTGRMEDMIEGMKAVLRGILDR